MATYRVYLTATASLSVEVDVPDGIDPDDAREAAIDKAYNDLPRDICAQCSGWNEKWTREIGDFEVDDDIAPELVD